MNSSTVFKKTCGQCYFSSFCLDEKKTFKAHPLRHSLIKSRVVKRKEHLYFPKTKFQNLYIIRRGVVKTSQPEAGGKESIRSFYFSGEILGYESIYTGYYLTSAIALTDCAVCEIPYHNLLELIRTKPLMQKNILYLISRQLNMGSYLSVTTAEQRLAAFILDVASRLQPANALTEFTLPMSRQDIGNYLRLTSETVSRLFTRFQRNKILTVTQKKVHLIKPEKLYEISEGHNALPK